MTTAVLIIAHAMRRNPEFKPVGLYFGTFILDLQLIDAVARFLNTLSA